MNVKTLTISNIILIIAVIALFIMQLSNCKNKCTENKENIKITETKHKTDSITKEHKSSNDIKLKLAFVNSDSVAAYYDFSKDMTARLKEKQVSAEGKLKSLYSKYEKQRKSFEEQAPIMGQQEMQRKAQEIGVLEQSIMQKEQELSAKLAKIEAEVMTDYVYKTDEFMQKIGKELGYDYVLSYRVGGPMLYANPELDITKDIIKLLNSEYKASKQTK